MITFDNPLNILIDIASQQIDRDVEIIFGELENCLGSTLFPDDNSSILITLDYRLGLVQCLDILAHELAHVIAGHEAEHDERWQRVYDDLNREYTKNFTNSDDTYKEAIPAECKHKYINVSMCEYCGLMQE